MGRRLNVSTPTVINTELVPLDESFYLDVDGQTEQWYYDNTEQYAPNRKVTPLLLVPIISAFDKDTNTSYTPAFNTTQWFANEWNETQGKYVETEITNHVDSGSADYVIQGNNLLVKKNVSYSHAVSIRCVATYIDPRDSGLTYAVEDGVNLTTNRTADVVFPEVDIISPSGRAYNPLVDDENSQYDFKGVTTNNPVQPLNTDVRRYSVDVDGTEEILNSGEAVAPIMDIRYGENLTSENQEFMYRQTAGGTLVGESIDKAYIERIKGNTVAWNQITTPNYVPRSAANIQISIDGTRCTVTNIGYDGSVDDYIAVHNYTSIYTIPYHKYICLVNSGITQGDGLNVPTFEIGGSAVTSTSLGGNQYGAILNPYRGRDILLFKYGGTKQIGDSWWFDKPMLFDLTLIYGAGNEPTTSEQFEADYERWFGKPLTYEEYDAGSLRPVLMQSVKTTGFNQWDEEWEYAYYPNGVKIAYPQSIGGVNLIKVYSGKTYYFRGGLLFFIGYYNSDAQYIQNHPDYNDGGRVRLGTGGSLTIPSGVRFIRISGYNPSGQPYNHDICINISDPSKNGTYEPYEEKVQGFDVTAIKGKLNGAGNSVAIFPDGLKKAGNIQDEIFVENGVVKAIKRVGSVDLGNTVFFKGGASTSAYDLFVSGANVLNRERTSEQSLCSRLLFGGLISMQSEAIQYGDGKYCFYRAESAAGALVVVQTAGRYNSVSEFQAAMNGVILYYELAEPQTYVLDPITDFVWYGIKNGQEVLADTLPWYVSGQGTDNLVVDAMYGENINVALRCKMMDGETLSPSKAYATLNWRIPDIETYVQSDNGGAVRSSTKNMTFDTIVNVSGDVLSDELKQKHLAFNWKIRKNNVSTEIDKGWGQRITIDASDLRNVKGIGSSLASTLVSNEVYLKGAYEEVTDDGEVVTDGEDVVYDRPID